MLQLCFWCCMIRAQLSPQTEDLPSISLAVTGSDVHRRNAYLTSCRKVLRPSSVMILFTSTAIECLRPRSMQQLVQSKGSLSLGGSTSNRL